MTLVLELPPDVEAQLAAGATERGVDPTAYALQILRAHLPQKGEAGRSAQAVEAPEVPTVALFRQWEEEDATADPEELSRRQQAWETFRENMNAPAPPQAPGCFIHEPADPHGRRFPTRVSAEEWNAEGADQADGRGSGLTSGSDPRTCIMRHPDSEAMGKGARL